MSTGRWEYKLVPGGEDWNKLGCHHLGRHQQN